MDSRYDQGRESQLYQQWEESGAFRAPTKAAAEIKGMKPFSIIMPPPNANDPLHVGHALFVSLEDILIRFHRMKGEAALWLPGTDHAGIETQYVFEKKLAKEDKSRFDFDRETLYQMIWDYVQENSRVAIDQMKQLGASADWERFKFTLDREVVDFVIGTFIKLDQDGLVYRGERLINYCVHCGTSYSELEVDYVEKKDPLYYLKYGPFVLATVRPETKFGDTAVAVNPKDKRYQDWVGKEIEIEGLIGKFKLKVVADEAVDPEFGTGVVKVTPAHDFNDYEIGQRHQLPLKQVIGFDGRLTQEAGPYAGLTVNQAREKVVTDLKEKGLLVKTDENYVHRVGTCYRCGRTIEPLPRKQWFVKVRPLADKALAALDRGEVKIYGPGRETVLRQWLVNLKDWNISRQIVWGIRMPIWYQGEEYVINKTSPGEGWVQETDTFDTWFSSAQWPVVTLATGKPGDGEYYYPTDVMETAYDILIFWVMRMLMMGIYLTGKVPFRAVYLHGLVRDEKGQKMSKSKGNVINPLNMAEKYGADAVRMALVMSSAPGTDKNVGEETIRGMRNFANKIWNAARYVRDSSTALGMTKEAAGDDQFREKLEQVVNEVTRQLDEIKIGMAAETVYNRFWHWFCDECIEKSKGGEISGQALKQGYLTFLKLLHPFVPFVTEAVWQELGEDGMLMSKTWPSGEK